MVIGDVPIRHPLHLTSAVSTGCAGSLHCPITCRILDVLRDFSISLCLCKLLPRPHPDALFDDPVMTSHIMSQEM